MKAAKTRTTASVFGANRKTSTASAARRVDQREQRLHAPAADRPAHREAADDVEQADDRQRPGADRRRQLARGDDARQVRGDEGDVEAADEEAGREQQVARVVHRAPDRLARRLARAPAPRSARLPRRRSPPPAPRCRAAPTPRAARAGRSPPCSGSRSPSRRRAVMPCAIGTKTNWPNEPPALTMPLAMPRLRRRRQARRRRQQHRRPGEAGAAGGEHADGDDQAEASSSSAARARCRARPGAGRRAGRGRRRSGRRRCRRSAASGPTTAGRRRTRG